MAVCIGVPESWRPELEPNKLQVFESYVTKKQALSFVHNVSQSPIEATEFMVFVGGSPVAI